ncbi:hypothetical protein N9Z67_03090, partial [Rhodopirellula sp.]|nr:hypothetical protein [Rhodopirellula sp.]
KDPEERPFNARQVQALMLQLVANVDTNGSNVGKQPTEDARAEDVGAEDVGAEDVGAEDVVARGKDLLQQEIRQAAASTSFEVSWGRLVALVALVLAMIAFASVLGR